MQTDAMELVDWEYRKTIDETIDTFRLTRPTRSQLYPLWRDMVHRILVHDGECGCVKQDVRCILRASEEEMIAHMESTILSFGNFVDIILTAYNVISKEQ